MIPVTAAPLRTRTSASLAAWLALLLALMLGGCATLREVPRLPSHAISDPEHTTIGRAFAGAIAQHAGMSGFQVVADGRSAFATRAALADAAERTLDLQYFSAANDRTTEMLLLRIVAAAERGVRVRILLDDVHASTRLFAQRAMTAHPGIQVRLFNPFYSGGTSTMARLAEFVFNAERLNRRMHNKMWVADGVAAMVGSRNLGDEYFDANESFNFLDVDLLAVGPVAQELSRAFDAYWNSSSVTPIEAFVEAPGAAERALALETLRSGQGACRAFAPCRWLAESKLLADLRAANVPLAWARSRLIYDTPQENKAGGSASGIGHGSIHDHPGNIDTRAELLIVSPYFVPNEDLHSHLGTLRERGVRIAVLTNSLASTDAPAAHGGYANHRVALLREGVELYEVRPESAAPHRFVQRWVYARSSSLHAKVIVQDRQRASVGSLNQDPRSRLHNTEACIILESPELAAELAGLFDEGVDLEHAFKVEHDAAAGEQALVWQTQERDEIVRYTVEPMSSPWLRLWRGILGVLIPEHLL